MLVQQVVPEFCYPKLAQKLCVGICVRGAVSSTLIIALKKLSMLLQLSPLGLEVPSCLLVTTLFICRVDGKFC